MDPPSPSAPPPATFARDHHTKAPTQPNNPDSCQYVYSEKDAYPHPQQYDPQTQRGSKGSSQSRAHDSVISHPLSPKPASPPSPASSISSGPRKQGSTPEIQQSRGANNAISYPPRAHLDPEKGFPLPYRSPSPTRVSASNPDVTTVLYDSGEYHEKGPEDKPVHLLLFLSGPCALLSFAITLWTIFALLIALALQPLRLLSSRPPLSAQLTTFLAPPLNLQLHLIYSYSASTDYSPAMLVIVHLFSPFMAAGVAIGAWTAACFWFFSMILGDPAGQDHHNDGKDSILGVRSWWDRWLSRALR